MKLPDFFNFEPLNIIKDRMGIPRGVYGNVKVLISPSRLSEEELRALSSPDGLDVEFEDVNVLDDGTLGYKGSRVLLYIRDVNAYGGGNIQPRYHLGNCTKLQEMRRRRRFGRYVIATRTNGRFKLNIVQGGQKVSSDLYDLSVCQCCLHLLSFDGFDLQGWPSTKRREHVRRFSLEEFFRRYPKSLHDTHPVHDDANAPLNDYPPNFPEISTKAKEAVDWICQKCLIDLSAHSHRKYLHTHHKNGAKNENHTENLKVLCFGCHSEEEGHQHMKRLSQYSEFIGVKAEIAR